MQHPDPDDLALLGLGENLGSAVDAHVADCAACTSDIEKFRATVGLAELSNFGEDAPPPGEHVWQAIAAELGFAGAAGSVATIDSTDRPAPAVVQSDDGAVPADSVSSPLPQQADPLTTRNGTAPHLRSVPPSDPSDGSDMPAPGIAEASESPSRWSRWLAPLAATVVGIAIGAGAVVLAQSQSNDVTIEAIAPLKPVPDGPLGTDTGTLGEAELVAAPNGQQVRVSADQLPKSPNAYEVWLFGDDGKMVSLGTLNDRTGSFTVPQGINTAEYRVVDISDESPDGNPLHSGISLIRGEFS